MNNLYTTRSVLITNDIIEKAKQFAEAVTPTTNYADANQFATQKIINDHFISKIGEEAVAKVLFEYGEVIGPDYNIYHGKSKNWDDDLYYNNIGIAVKTQKRSSALRYGLSWTFQCSTTRRDLILNKHNAWVIFAEYHDVDANRCTVYPPFQIKQLVFAEPKLEKLKDHKLVVYATSLPL